ncbi:hypothetical protein GWO63_000475 [Corynebacterium macginleyi]|uniref:HTH luxR-type domain-containing protein n=1 Tax=Corynebacterium macginleyi TaxID=38290 RepID=A0ABS1Y366_9CORY|nr:LuxR C-terminal-related transcriptional regulator [Corynebacterium macginleyi]MBK4143658.1 hypothetical protein [Corynebacterium macginleyi]MBK4165024.1 hypothetical protein [Corynebacterium macginleyi]MBM0242829.1 hypothetical protein [Corynebacterium macginleyi]
MTEIIEEGICLNPVCIARLVELSVFNHRSLTEVETGISLQDEEIEVISDIRQGLTTDRIAREMNYAEITVKRKISTLMKKFNANSRAELVLLSQFKLFNN